jgi:uncharacterized protein
MDGALLSLDTSPVPASYTTLKIINRTNGLVLAQDAGLADTIFKRMKGLLGKSSLSPGEGLVIRPCISIHTFGMKFAIDVVFFDGSNKAVAVLHHLKPLRATRLFTSATGVIELPAGTLDVSPVEPGDELEFVS